MVTDSGVAGKSRRAVCASCRHPVIVAAMRFGMQTSQLKDRTCAIAANILLLLALTYADARRLRRRRESSDRRARRGQSPTAHRGHSRHHPRRRQLLYFHAAPPPIRTAMRWRSAPTNVPALGHVQHRRRAPLTGTPTEANVGMTGMITIEVSDSKAITQLPAFRIQVSSNATAPPPAANRGADHRRHARRPPPPWARPIRSRRSATMRTTTR